MVGKSKKGWIILSAVVVVIKVFSRFPGAVERYYSAGFYPVIVRILRLLLGWIPFSIGDVLYTSAVVWLIYGLVMLVRRIVQRKADRAWVWGVVRGTLFVMLLVYAVFNLFWGLNYDRKGIAQQLELKVQPYSNTELARLVQLTVTKLNGLDSVARQDRSKLEESRYLLEGAIGAYWNLSATDARFAYPLPSIKPSMFGTLGNYLGFSGYYNPFTGEAQVNVATPSYTQPFTACHEIGHQLGYAKENEANFSGFLSAHASSDPKFLYSAYFDMYYYAARELYVRDSMLLVPLRESLHPAIRRDFRELAAFNRSFGNPFEPVVRRMYGGYLRANRQPQGLHTYNEVVAWLIAYATRYGWDKI